MASYRSWLVITVDALHRAPCAGLLLLLLPGPVSGFPKCTTWSYNMPNLAPPPQVSYSYSSLGLLQKPLLLVGVLGAAFALAIVAGRGGLSSLAASPSVRNVVAKPHAS